MSLIVAINGVYHSYFNNESKVGRRTQEQKDKLFKAKQSLIQKNATKEYQEKKSHKRINGFAYEIMSHPVSVVAPEDSIALAKNKLEQIKAHHLLVVEDERIVGIISDRDLFKNSDKELILKVSDVMTSKVLLCKRDTEVRLIAQIMLDENISCLPVVNDEHIIQGIITHKDLLRCIVRNMPLDIWM